MPLALRTVAATAMALCMALLSAAPAPAAADLVGGLAAPPSGANVSDLVTDGLAADGTIIDEDIFPAGTDFDSANTELEGAADSFNDTIGDGTSAAGRMHASPAAAAAAAVCAAAAVMNL